MLELGRCGGGQSAQEEEFRKADHPQTPGAEVLLCQGKAVAEIAGDGVSLKLRAGMREPELTALRDQIRRRVGIRP